MSKDDQEQGRRSAEDGQSEYFAPDNPDGDNKTLEGDQSDSNTKEKSEKDGHKYPGGVTLIAIMIAVYLAMFLVALDRTIIATAIPRITDDFHALSDVGWYGSSYLLTSCAFQLVFGRIYTFYSPKIVFLVAIALFEAGSAVCGAAPTSTAFIVGRAIAGLGSCGIMAGIIVIITDSVPLQKRPMYTGFMGSIFGVSSIVAPLMGGALTDRVSWRWCFYINLPVGAVTVIVIVFLLKATPPPNPSKAVTLWDRFDQLDPFGTFTFLPGMVCLILAMQWGGTTYPWDNGRIIALFVLFGVLIAAFVAIQICKQEIASVPPRIIKIRSITGCVFYALCTGGSMMLIIYYIPIWFQAIKGATAVKSGIMNLPLVLGVVVTSILAGVGVSRLGYSAPFMYASTVTTSIGAGLLTTFTTSTGHDRWIGYQALYGLGLGMGMQQPSVVAQTVLARKDVPTGASLMILCQSLGGAIFVAAGQTIFANSLVKNLEEALPNRDGDFANFVVNKGATSLRDILGAGDLPPVLTAYNGAVTHAFIVSLALSSASILGALVTKWVSVKKAAQDQSNDPEKDVAES